MGIIKIVVNTTEFERILYTELPKTYRALLSFMEDNIKSDNYLIYWIDDENDKVEVNNEISYNMFFRICERKKLFVVNDGASKKSNSSTEKDKNNMNKNADVNIKINEEREKNKGKREMKKWKQIKQIIKFVIQFMVEFNVMAVV